MWFSYVSLPLFSSTAIQEAQAISMLWETVTDNWKRTEKLRKQKKGIGKGWKLNSQEESQKSKILCSDGYGGRARTLMSLFHIAGMAKL